MSTNHSCFSMSYNKTFTVLQSHIIMERSSLSQYCLYGFFPFTCLRRPFALLTYVVKICNLLGDCHCQHISFNRLLFLGNNTTFLIHRLQESDFKVAGACSPLALRSKCSPEVSRHMAAEHVEHPTVEFDARSLGSLSIFLFQYIPHPKRRMQMFLYHTV